MNRVVWKYRLGGPGGTAIHMPPGAELLHVDYQGKELTLWAFVDPDRPDEEVTRYFSIVGTGSPIQDPTRYFHVGTVLEHGGALVWHVFEILS
jgi:hypothetical protein